MPASPAARPTRPITIVCHLLPGPASAGHIVGRVEVVSTGDVISITHVAQLVALVARLATGEEAD